MKHDCENHPSTKYPGQMIDHSEIVARLGECGICDPDECKGCQETETAITWLLAVRKFGLARANEMFP